MCWYWAMQCVGIKAKDVQNNNNNKTNKKSRTNSGKDEMRGINWDELCEVVLC